MLKPWMKVLIWAGLGGGIGFFAGMQVGAAQEQRRQSEAIDICEKSEYKKVGKVACEVATAMKDYFGNAGAGLRVDTDGDVDGDEFNIDGDFDGDEPEMPTENDILIDPEIPQLHPQHLIPEIIGEEEFNINIWHYEIENLIFYSMDEVLYNEDTQSIIENPEDVVGHGTLMEFNADPRHPVYTIFVKNDTFGTLFRIDYVDAAFCDAVDGTCPPEDDEPEEEFTDDDFWDDV